RDSPRKSFQEGVNFCCASLCISFLPNCGHYGQINLFVLILICLMSVAMKRSLSLVAITMPIVIASVWKGYPLIFASLFLIKRNYKAFIIFFLFLLSFSAFSYVILPEAIWEIGSRYRTPNWIWSLTQGACRI